MLAKTSLIALCAISASYYLVDSLKPPVPATSAQPVGSEPRREVPLRVPFGPPTRKAVSRQLQKGTVHVYPLPLKAGEFVTIIAYQDGVDLKVSAAGADDKPFLTVDSPNGNKGDERLPFVADAAGTYRVEVQGSSELETGYYKIWIASERKATNKDRKDAEAEILFFQAKAQSSSAEKQLRKAAKLWAQAGKQVRQADALRTIGQLYVNKVRWKKALPLWRDAKVLYHRARDFASEGKLDLAIGTEYQRHSLVEEAGKSFQQALINGRRGRRPRVVAGALYSLGAVLKAQGRAVEALERIDQARMAWKGLDLSEEAKSLIAIGKIFADAGKLKQAMENYHEALSLLKRGEDSNTKAFAWIGIAEVYSKNKEQEQARYFFREALRIQRQTKSTGDMPLSLNGIALTFLNDGKPKDAVEPFQRTLDLVSHEDRPLDQAVVLTNLGWTYSLLNQERESRIAYERALALAKGKNAQVEAAAFLGLTRLEQRRGDPIAAQRQAESAVRSVESMRAVVGRDLQVSFFATEQDVYDALIEVLLWEHHLHPFAGFAARALQVSEQARSRSLLDSVSSLRKSVVDGPHPPVPVILSLSEIQRSVLDPDTLLLEYHLGKSESYLWVVDQNSFRLFKLPPRQQIEDLARKTSQLLMVSSHHERFREARQVSEELSRVLLRPAGELFGKKRLAISSPAVLQAVPFGDLPDPMVPGVQGSAEQWPQPLFFEHEVVRIPSASVIAAIRARAAGRKPPPNRLAVIADPVSSNRDERLTGRSVASPATRSESAINSLYGNFGRLDHAKEEAEAISSEAGSKGVWSATGFDATRELVLSGRLRSFQNLHFSMHGLFSSDDGASSALVLSLWDRHGRRRNGFLLASEIYGLDLPANLVALSACNTGRGESVPGEGVVGLSQAFIAAGATQVMMSLWPIDDFATSRLMKLFYHEYLAKGLPPTAALREAQKSMLKSPVRKAPFYWGGFEIQGDWNPTSARR